MRIVGVIPARYGSGRLPGKPIADILGRPMIWWVYQQALKSTCFNDVVVATDDERIADTCSYYDMKFIMTSSHDTPTSRLCEVSQKMESDLYLMIMGDEPLVDEKCFSLIIPTGITENYYVAALSNVIENPAEVIDFSNQKVVTNSERNTLFISRSPIPYPKGSLVFKYEKVTGVQLFSKAALEFYNRTSKSLLEQAEENDLMRFIEHGIPVKMIQSKYKTISVDTPKDLELVREILRERCGYE